MLLRTKLHGKTYHPRMRPRIHEYRLAHSFIRECSWMVSADAQASEQEIQDMMHFVDTVAEIQNTLRVLTSMALSQIEVVNV